MADNPNTLLAAGDGLAVLKMGMGASCSAER